MKHLVGMRINKTMLSLIICLLASYAVGYGIPVYACIAAVSAMKVTPEQSVQSGKDRIFATLIGCSVAGLSLWLITEAGVANTTLLYRLLLALTVFINLILCKLAKFKEYVTSFSCMIIIIVLISHTGSDVLTYTLVRVVETIAGILVAVAVNKYVNVPDRFRSKHDDEEDDDE